jgi:pimeloyl-ACP methyl ester carboxylesterase
MNPSALTIMSEAETLRADLYGVLPSRRAAILVHGQSWDADGWKDVAPLLVERGVAALALNLRGHGGSTGETKMIIDDYEAEYTPPASWSPVIDLRAAKKLLRERGAEQIALVGSSLGGHAVLASSFDGDAECVVSQSAPVVPVNDELSRMIKGRKLFVCADGDHAAPNVSHTYGVAATPKMLILFGGSEHSRRMFTAPYADDLLDAIVSFVARGL